MYKWLVAISFKNMFYNPLFCLFLKPFQMATLPELKRVPKSSVFGGGSTSVDVEVEQQQQQQPNQQQEQQILTRNMLMNIILRPGGGDKTRALPRPQVRKMGLVKPNPIFASIYGIKNLCYTPVEKHCSK